MKEHTLQWEKAEKESEGWRGWVLWGPGLGQAVPVLILTIQPLTCGFYTRHLT